MDTLFFILMLACLGLVLGWYVANEATGGRGGAGLLAIRDDDAADAAKPSYRNKRRLQPPARGAGAAQATPTFAARAVDGYKEKDEPGYRETGSPPRYGEKPPRESGPN